MASLAPPYGPPPDPRRATSNDSHSPFRQHKTRDKHEIDRMTMTMSIEMPDSFSIELRSLLTGLLQREVHKRLGCRGRGADEIKSHPFFRGVDWRVVYLQRLAPPLIPARGEVNAADAFDIGSFDDEDTKHIKLTDADQELYRNFPVVVSERWQHEIAETIFEHINHEADKAEMKRKGKHKLGFQEEEQSDCILHGYIKRLGGTFTATWLTRYVRLYPNRLELWSDSGKAPELIFMDQIEEVCNDFVQIKGEQCIVIKLYNHSKYVLTNSDEIGLKEWHVSLRAAHRESLDMMTTMAEKATKIYGTEIPLKHMGKRRQQLQLEANSAPPSWEQKIIQKELQASSSSTTSGPASEPKQQPPPARATTTTTPAPPSAKMAPGPAPATDHAPVMREPPAGSENQPPTHKHHRAHHSHRPHHHHHHHHHHQRHHHEPTAADGSQSTSGAHRHHHHHHARSAGAQVAAGPRPAKRSSSGEQMAQAAKAAARQLERPLAPEADEVASQVKEGAGEELSEATQTVALQTMASKEDKMAESAEERPTRSPRAVKAGPGEAQPGRVDRENSLSSVEDSASSSSSGSQSCSGSSADEEQPAEAALAEALAQISLGRPQPGAELAPAPEGADRQQVESGESAVKLAVSLENVSEQQEVLRDPSKRITSDNKQREQDLVAQYEKLNVSARTSSSSMEEENVQNAA